VDFVFGGGAVRVAVCGCGLVAVEWLWRFPEHIMGFGRVFDPTDRRDLRRGLGAFCARLAAIKL
jgi:hypothetical protein